MRTSAVRARRTVARSLALLALPFLAACSELGYYGHLLRGQVSVLRAREDIDDIVADDSRDATLRARLQNLQQAHRWAIAELALPDDDSYETYVQLDRPYVVWNVYAAPEFSLEAHRWCYLLVGCLAYRGYYEESQARDFAQEMRAQGLDVHVGGVSAYSTLGWFDDPVLSSMMRWDDDTLTGTLFHEVAHRRLFVEGDTAFNESYASFVEREGLRLWLLSRGRDPDPRIPAVRREQQFVELLDVTRQDLEMLYAEPHAPELMRERKRNAFEALRSRYHALRDGQWGGYAGYDAWFAEELNNARLVTVGLYEKWVPAFSMLYLEAEGTGVQKWEAFHRLAAELGKLPAAEREQRLERLGEAADKDVTHRE